MGCLPPSTDRNLISLEWRGSDDSDPVPSTLAFRGGGKVWLRPGVTVLSSLSRRCALILKVDEFLKTASSNPPPQPPAPQRDEVNLQHSEATVCLLIKSAQPQPLSALRWASHESVLRLTNRLNEDDAG